MDFFTPAKLGWFAVAPSHLLVWLLLAAALLCARRVRAGAVLTVFCATVALALLTLPIGSWALQSIENRYPRPPWPERVDGVLVLGEGLIGEMLDARGMASVGPYGGTFIATWILARRYPQARIVFSGGSDKRENRGVPEATVAEQIFQQMGLTGDRIVFEAKSKNTWENIAFSKTLATPGPDETWLLVASAYHMPRAMAVAKRLDWRFIPWPSDFRTLGKDPEVHPSFSVDLSYLDLAAHEWLGLLIYRLDRKAL